MARDDYKLGGHVWIVPHELSWGAPAHVDLEDAGPAHAGKGGHVEHVVVREEEEVMCVVEPRYTVGLLPDYVPAFIKLVDGQRWGEAAHSWLHAHAHKALSHGETKV